MNQESVDLTVSLGRLTLKNPVMPSSGTFGYGKEFAELIDLDKLGALIVKGTTLHPRIGNPEKRCIEVGGSAYLTRVGLQNVGIERFINEKLPFLQTLQTLVIVNAACESIEEFVKVTEKLNGVKGISGIEANLACPNVSGGGMSFASSAEMTFSVIKAIRNATDLFLVAKFLPTRIGAGILAKTCEEAGADAVCPIFSPMGMAIDISTRRSKMGENLIGALGSPCFKAVAVRQAWEAAKAASIPVIGCGGITCPEDAIEFFIVGATAVQIGAQNLIDPTVTVNTIEGIRKYLLTHGIKSVKEIIGTLKVS